MGIIWSYATFIDPPVRRIVVFSHNVVPSFGGKDYFFAINRRAYEIAWDYIHRPLPNNSYLNAG